MDQESRDNRPSETADALEIVERIIDRRDSLGYMTVARAMVVKSYFSSPDKTEAQLLGRALEINRQTRKNWVVRGLTSWLARWRTRLATVPERTSNNGSGRQRIVDADLMWIAQLMSDKPWRSLEYVAGVVRSAARNDAEHSHQERISRSTIFRFRFPIQALMQEAHERKAATRAARPNSTPEGLLPPENPNDPF